MQKLTKFEVSELVAKWARGSEDDEIHSKIRNAILHAQRIIEEKNKKLPEFNSVRVNATINGQPARVNDKAWTRMWANFDAMMSDFGKLFD